MAASNIIILTTSILMILVTITALIYSVLIQQIKELTPKKTIKHVVLIVADDLGWADVAYGSGEGSTPTLDRLAREGIILNYTYTYSMCTPSRTAILTGMFTERTGLQHFVIDNGHSVQPVGIPTHFHLMPQYFNRRGFKSHIVGKWHVGSCKMEQTPIMRGFESFYGYFYGVQDYYSHKTQYLDVGEFLDFWYQSNNKTKPITDKSGVYSTFLYNNRITEIIDSHNKNEPLFLYYAAQNPHSDFKSNIMPKEYEDKFSYIEDEQRRKILAMVHLLDESVLNITRDLERNNMLNDTIFFFTSDNGGDIGDHQRNYPLRGGKTTVFEGGQRVRAFISGRNLGVEPYAYEGMFHSVDWIPTILSAALGQPTEIEGIDGVNQWEAIKSNGPSKRDSFIYSIDSYGARKNLNEHCNTSTEAIRVGDWKLIVGCPGLWTSWYNLTHFDLTPEELDLGIELSISEDNHETCLDPENFSPKRYFLFNIKDDPLEENNLAGHMACKIRELERQLREYMEITVEPELREPLSMHNDPRADPRNFGNMFWPGWC